MIITILPNSSNFHAVAYNEKKVSQGLAELIEVRNFSYFTSPKDYTAENFTDYLETYSHRNTRIQSAQFHVAISCKGDEYSYEQLLDIAHRYLKEMGYAEEGQPLLVYAHHDTPNHHIHIITSRVAPDGHKISKDFEKKRSREITERIMKEYEQNIGINHTLPTGEGWKEVVGHALSYRYTSKSQFCAILESQGYDCREDENNPVVHIYRNAEEVGTVPTLLIMQHALKDNRPDYQRRRQLKTILKKYRDLSANKEELAAAMKKKFGISLVFFGQKDSPYGYAIVDHKNKAVFKGGEFISIRELLQFEDAPTRFAKIEQTIDVLLADNPNLTTADINRILYRQFGTRIHQGNISWNGETITLKDSVCEQLRRNYLTSQGKTVDVDGATIPTTQARHRSQRTTSTNNPLANAGGSQDSNRESEIGHGMNFNEIDDEQSQRAKWRR
jgi:hypothetical protein